MRLTVKQLKATINEEYMRGVPEFMLRELTRDYVEQVRRQVQKHIQMTRKSPADAREAINIANETLKDLEDKVNQLLEDALWSYVQRT